MDIVAINRADMVMLLASGDVVDFDMMFDCDGDETEDAMDAVVAIVQFPNGLWGVVDLTQFDAATVH